MVLFQDVEVPWERVFIHNDAALSRAIYFEAPGHCLGNHQATIRFHEKLKVLLGVASTITELNGVGHIPAVQTTLGKLAAAEAGLGGMIAGQIEAAEAMVPGALTPNRRMMYAALQWCTTHYAPIAEEVRELLGAGPFQMPANSSVVADATLREAFETYWAVPGQSAIARLKFMQFAWDLLGGDFAGRHTQYEKFYAGPQVVNVAYNFLHCPGGRCGAWSLTRWHSMMCPRGNSHSWRQSNRGYRDGHHMARLRPAPLDGGTCRCARSALPP